MGHAPLGSGLPHPKANSGTADLPRLQGAAHLSGCQLWGSLAREPEKEFMLADQHARRCDLMLVLGSSLVVNPAASLVGLALRYGARTLLVNQGETPYDEVVMLRVWTGIGDVIPPAVERLKQVLKV